MLTLATDGRRQEITPPDKHDLPFGCFNTDAILSVTDNIYAYVGGNPIARTDPRGLEWRKSWTPDAIRKAVASVCGKSNGDIATDNTPTPTFMSRSNNPDSLKFRNMSTTTKYGKTNVDWALTLAQMSRATGLPPLALYSYGKLIWMVIDDPVKNISGHWRQYNGEADLNAVSMANDLVGDNIGFTDMFPGVDCSCKK